MAKMMTGGMAPKKQGKIGEAIDRMRIGRKAKLEAKSGAAADQGNAVKAKRLSNRAEKVGNRMELKALKKGGVLPATKTMGDYVGKGSLKGLGNMADAIGGGAKKLSNIRDMMRQDDESAPYRATPEEVMQRLGRSRQIKD
jgi:hypothetical protein